VAVVPNGLEAEVDEATMMHGRHRGRAGISQGRAVEVAVDIGSDAMPSILAPTLCLEFNILPLFKH
jgi:hypothetical protein